MKTRKKSVRRRRLGDFVAVPLGGGEYGFGRVLEEPLFAFYDFKSKSIPPVDEIARARVLFKIWVMNYAVTDGDWPIIGNRPLEETLCERPRFFKRDPINGKYSIYLMGESVELPATKDECNELECAAVWEPEHVADRLRDYFQQVPNKWFEMLRP